MLPRFTFKNKTPTSEELASAVTDIQAGIDDAQARVDELVNRRAQALFDGADAKVIAEELQAVRSDLETLRASLPIAQKKVLEAKEREVRDEFLKQAVAIRKEQGELQEIYEGIYDLTSELYRLIKRGEQLSEKRDTFNARAREAGYDDLVVGNPISDLAEKIGRPVRDPLRTLKLPVEFSENPFIEGDGPQVKKRLALVS